MSSEETYRDNSEMQYKIGLNAMEGLIAQNPEKVMDLGCGDGRLTIEIAKNLPDSQVVAIDMSVRMLDLAKEVARENEANNIEFVHLNALDMDYTNEFDAVFSNVVVHFLPNHKPFYQKIYDALKLGGLMVVTAFQSLPSGTIVNIDMDVMREVLQQEKFREYVSLFRSGVDGYYSAAKTQKILERTGFSNINVDSFDAFQQFENSDAWIAFTQLGRAEFMLGAFPDDIKNEIFEDEKSILAERMTNLPEGQSSDALKTTWATVVINANHPK